MKRYEVATFYDKNMNLINIPGIYVVDIEVPSIPFENVWGGGNDGITPYFQGVDIKQREITAKMTLIAQDVEDHYLLRSDLYGVFGYGTPFYIVLKKESGKKYKVILNSNYIPERIMPVAGRVEIPFVTVELPFAESIGTTQDIQRNGINAEDDLWGFGMGLIADDESLIYTHTGTSFRIFNAGNVPIHPFEQELKITISNVQVSNSFLELRNLTTKSIFRVNEAVTPGQKIEIDGPNITINSLQGLRKTNKKFIGLAPGWNNFAIMGATSARVEVDFRFYYL